MINHQRYYQQSQISRFPTEINTEANSPQARYSTTMWNVAFTGGLHNLLNYSDYHHFDWSDDNPHNCHQNPFISQNQIKLCWMVLHQIIFDLVWYDLRCDKNPLRYPRPRERRQDHISNWNEHWGHFTNECGILHNVECCCYWRNS